MKLFFMKLFYIYLDQYLSSIIKKDPELFDEIQAILAFVKDNQIDYRKF